MQICLLSSEKDLAVTGQDVVRLFYPTAEISLQPMTEAEIVVRVSACQEGQRLVGAAEIKTKNESAAEEVTTDLVPVRGDERNNQKRLVKLAIFRLLGRLTGTPPGPWGILTGIRPTKIVHRLLDLNWKPQEIADYLVSGYDMAAGKAHSLIDIALRQRPFLLSPAQARELVSAYIGVPFCPTRCAYCSFPSYPAARHGQMIQPFLQALQKEIRIVGQALAEIGIGIQTIYIGGGTPTVFAGRQLASLLGSVQEYLVTGDTREVTLEAGRPDTITEDKLEAARRYGVTRLSVNPQSMNSKTLALIGRQHSPEDVIASIDLARELGFHNINMDIIAGLPGENLEDLHYTLDEITRLKPENLTVHTLAVKRASRINETRQEFTLPAAEMVEKMLAMAAQYAKNTGMHPYYLYRQKKMVGPLENVGYALPGYDCIYNIQIIEERQSIIGFGGGAGSKFVEPETWYLTSHYNPKDPESYISRLDEFIDRKVAKLREVMDKPGM